jgi:hypothetical protein
MRFTAPATVSTMQKAPRSHSGRSPNLSRGAIVRGDRPIDQVEASARFIAAPEHEKVHDERLWDLRQKRDRCLRERDSWSRTSRRSAASAVPASAP